MMFFPDPDLDFVLILDPGSWGPGSGSATLPDGVLMSWRLKSRVKRLSSVFNKYRRRGVWAKVK
jgi:hypothetical protein